MKKLTILALTLCATWLSASAKIELTNIFTDNMVIQSDTEAALWGKATPGSTVTVNGSWGAESSAKADKEGKWSVKLPTPKASFDPLSITITDKKDSDTVTLDNILSGEVWVASGQSNMEMPLMGFWTQPVEGGGEQITFSRKLGKGIRFVTVPKAISYEPQENFEGKWVESTPENAGDFSAVAWYFATALRDIVDVPVGIIVTAYGGSRVEGWEPKEILATYPDIDIEAEKTSKDITDWYRANTMYNAMLLPIAGYTARGFLWNQGEANVGQHDRYPQRQLDMVNHWRELWGNKEMPFYFVELPGWDYSDVNGTVAALFREAQHKADEMDPNSHIVCTSDLVYEDEPDDIHARNKRPIGNRLAQAAATFTYGVKGVPHIYPTFKEMDNRGNEAELFFNDAWRGFTPNENITGFEVAGEDKKFHPANATIDREKLTITVSAPEVENIVAVRYCFKNFAIGRLHDMVGMPLVPFRTDNWEE